MKPLVSAIIINHNYAPYLPQAVESVLAQDLPAGQLEVIVVDGASTDNSREVLKPYLDRIRLVEKPYDGMVSSCNWGLREARGDWAAFLESDDFWRADKLKRTLSHPLFGKGPALFQHWMLQVDKAGAPLPGYDYPAGPESFDFLDTVRGLPYAGTSCILMKTDAIKPYLPFPEDILYGADAFLRWIAAARGPIVNIPETLAFRRIHGANLFGEQIYGDPVRAANAAAVSGTMMNFLDEVCRREGLTLPPPVRRHLKAEHLKLVMADSAHKGRLGPALRAWAAFAANGGPAPLALARSAAALLLASCPPLYLKAQALAAALRRRS
ncbi:MAG: glycosyltransferase [Elusimicrobiales bacterium]|nr:glycosyltransferase [Elusimicrobiales bacterium]